MHGSRGATCCARDRHQTWTNVVLAQIRVPNYTCVSLYDAQTITCGQTVPMLSCYNTSYSTCVQQVVIAIQFALPHFPGSYLPRPARLTSPQESDEGNLQDYEHVGIRTISITTQSRSAEKPPRNGVFLMFFDKFWTFLKIFQLWSKTVAET